MTGTCCESVTPDTSLRAVARRVAAALDHAVDCGMFRQADRLARDATRLAPHSTRLADRLARLRLAQNRPEAALNILDAVAKMPASMRLLRNICLIRLGRRGEAHLDLHAWTRKSTAPLAARRLLAHLDADAGDIAAAAAPLVRNLAHADDAAAIELLLVLSVQQDRPEQTQHWAGRLQQAFVAAQTPVNAQLLFDTLGIKPELQSIQPTDSQVEALALELAGEPDAIDPLVEHQQREFQLPTAQLLYDALTRAQENLAEPLVAIEGLARLATLLGCASDAVQWAQQGLKINPMSATLRLVLERSEADEPDTTPADEDAVIARLEKKSRRAA